MNDIQLIRVLLRIMIAVVFIFSCCTNGSRLVQEGLGKSTERFPKRESFCAKQLNELDDFRVDDHCSWNSNYHDTKEYN